MPHGLSVVPEGVYFCQHCTWICMRNLFLLTDFSHNYPPINTSIRKRSTKFLFKLGAFYHNLLKIRPIYVIYAPSSQMTTLRSLSYQILRNCTWKGRTYIRKPRQCENPPGCDVRSDTDEEEQRKEEDATQEEEREKNELLNLTDIIMKLMKT